MTNVGRLGGRRARTSSTRPTRSPDRLLDRRQRGRELRRRALLQVRLHHQLRRAGWRSCWPTASSCTLGGHELDPPGYDLLGAFVGSEGTLGIATKVWLRVVPSPETVRTLVAFFDSTARRPGEAVTAIVQAGVVPGAIEMMDTVAIEASEQMAHAGYPVGRGRGAARRARRRRARVRRRASTRSSRMCERCGSDDVRVARDEAERQLFWKTRKAAFPAMGRISPNYFVQDGVIPRTKLPEVLEAIDELGRRVRADRRQRLPRRRRQPAPARVLRRRATRARPSGPRSCPAGSSTRASRPAARSPASTASASTRSKHMPKMFERGRPRRVPAAALRVRPGRARQPRQGDADAAAVRRGARALPAAPARGGRPGGAVLMARQPRRGGRRGGCATLGAGGTAGAAARRRDEAGWGAAGRRRASTRDRRRWTGSLEHNAGDFTAVLEAGVPLARRAGRVRRARARCSRSTRRSAATRPSAG